MSLLVQKFGGTSVSDSERIRAVADHVARTRRLGQQVIVVVSAMGNLPQAAARLGVVSSITKPFDVDTLVDCVRRAVSARYTAA